MSSNSLDSITSDSNRIFRGTATAGIAIAIIILVLGVGAFAGWLAWKRNKQLDDLPSLSEIDGQGHLESYGTAHYSRSGLEGGSWGRDGLGPREVRAEGKGTIVLKDVGDDQEGLGSHTHTSCYELPADSPRIKPGFF